MALNTSPEIASATAPAPKQPRTLELDGIRGVAVLIVVLFHYTIIGPGAPFNTMLYWGRAAFRSDAASWPLV